MIEETYIKQRPKSRALYEKALNIFPSGVTHDTRFILPFPIYVSEAKCSRKWDVDGNEYVDFAMGHGALLLGHGREEVINAVREAVLKGTHYGGSSELEIKWGEIVKRLVPSAERVKFTSSGTEATLLALRIARAYTGKSKIIKFHGHFHGWQDYLVVGERPPWELPPVGIPEEVLRTVIALPCDLSIIEMVRELTKKYDVLLIFDEVVTGFRWSPGGVQGLYGIIPDLTTLAKILAGGFPGGAVAGRKDILEPLEFSVDEDINQKKKIKHQGTFNANPVSAAAGIACLDIASTGKPQKEASDRAAEIRKALNEIIKAYEVRGCVYGDSSVFHIALGIAPRNFTAGDIRHPMLPPEVLKMGAEKNLARLFQLSMLTEGVDIFHLGGLVSSAHTDEDVERTVKAFEITIERLRREGVLK